MADPVTEAGALEWAIATIEEADGGHGYCATQQEDGALLDCSCGADNMMDTLRAALAARSAGSGSRVEQEPSFVSDGNAWNGPDPSTVRPTPPPAVCDGCPHAPHQGQCSGSTGWGRCACFARPTMRRWSPPPAVDGWTFEALTGDGWAILPPPSEDFPEDGPRGDWQASGYGSAIAYRREDAVRIVNALNGTPPPAVDGTRVDARTCGNTHDPVTMGQCPFCGWEPRHDDLLTPPTPAPADRLRALEADDIDRVIRNWWNDGPRKTWRRDFVEPEGRREWFDELRRQLLATIAARALLADGEGMEVEG